ncbi:MAG: hypothetical protein KF709_11960 [Gemmatimonadaceae bacterium]|nr:hypothetical protein [Gemmatimonadaceae bacterium]
MRTSTRFAARGLAAALLTASLALPAAAQEPLQKDSLEFGRKFAEWFRASNADSAAAHMTANLLNDLGGRDGVLEGMSQIAMRAGDFVKILEEQFAWRGGKRQYWQTAQMSSMTEPVVYRFVMEPNGQISGLGVNPISRRPDADSAGPVIKP